MKKSIMITSFSLISAWMIFSACGTESQMDETPQAAIMEDITETVTETDAPTEIYIPSKEEVLAMREQVLEGMSQEEIDRLTENIKIANLQMERAYLNENIFDKLSDPESVYWNYFDQTGEIQLGWWYHGNIVSMDAIMRAEGISEEEFYEIYDEPGIVYNRFDAVNFIDLIQDMQESVDDELLAADLQQLIDLTELAAETHKVEYAVEIYHILHDLDYFLLRYGMEDVGKYTVDDSTVAKYYNVLTVYGAAPVNAESGNEVLSGLD